MDSKIKYNYHDSYIDEIEIGEGSIVFFAVLYSAYYSDSPRVKVDAKGVYNFQNVKKYFQSILASADDGEVGCVVEAMHLDEKMDSTEGSIYVYLKTAWEGAIRIHCANIEESA